MSGSVQIPVLRPDKRSPDDVVSLTIFDPKNKGAPEKFVGWKSVRITRRLLGCPSDFDLELTEKFPGRGYLIYPEPGLACEVRIGEELVMSGYLDRYHASISPHGHHVRVQGRSKCQDVVDCHITPEQLNGQEMTTASLVEIGTKLCEPYGITVKSLTGNNVPVSALGNPGMPATFAANLQETPWEILERVARSVGVLIYDDVDGNLVFANVGTSKMQSGFSQGVNVQEASVTYSMDQRFQVYLPVTQSVNFFGGAMGYGGQNFPPFVDKGVKRFRQRIVVSDAIQMPSGTLVEQRARWEAARRYGQSQAVRIVADQWRDEGDEKRKNRKLWAPNAFAIVDLPALHLSPPDPWVISEVTYLIDAERGTTAELVLMPQEAFQPMPDILTSFLWDPSRAPPSNPSPASPAAASGTTGGGNAGGPAQVSVGGAGIAQPNGSIIFPDGSTVYADGSKTASDGFLIRGPDIIRPDGSHVRAPTNQR